MVPSFHADNSSRRIRFNGLFMQLTDTNSRAPSTALRLKSEVTLSAVKGAAITQLG
jgi:hypothetical protein